MKKRINNKVNSYLTENQEQEDIFGGIHGVGKRIADRLRQNKKKNVIDGDDIFFHNDSDAKAHHRTSQKYDRNKSFVDNIKDAYKLGDVSSDLINTKRQNMGFGYGDKTKNYMSKGYSGEIGKETDKYLQNKSDLNRYNPYFHNDYASINLNAVDDVGTNRKRNAFKVDKNFQPTSNIRINRGGKVDNDNTLKPKEISYNEPNHTFDKDDTIGLWDDLETKKSKAKSNDNFSIGDISNTKEDDFAIAANEPKKPKRQIAPLMKFDDGDKYAYTTKSENDSNLTVQKLDKKGKKLVVTNQYPISARKLTTFLTKKNAQKMVAERIIREEILRVL